MKNRVLLLLLILFFVSAWFVYDFYNPTSEAQSQLTDKIQSKTAIRQTDETLRAELNALKNFDNGGNWQQVGSHLYFDKNSVKINEGSIIEGRFAEFTKKETFGDKILLKLIKTGAFCDIEAQDGYKKLEYPIYEYYDNNKLVFEENIRKYWEETYPDGHLGITHSENEPNGEIYFSKLCSCI